MDAEADSHDKPKKGNDQETLADAKKAFDRCKNAEQHNRDTFLEDRRFALLGEQWDGDIAKTRRLQNRPCLVINRLNSMIKQVVNDSRQNKPSIKVRAVDSNGDPKTADVIAGLIRNIEYSSNADVAYDTGVENAASGGFGYIRVGMDYAYNDAFEMDLNIERVMNSLSVYGDPNSTSVDGSDWDEAFITDRMPKTQFKAKYGEDKSVNCDFDGVDWEKVEGDWHSKDDVMIAEWWQRKETTAEIVKLSDGTTVEAEDLETDPDLMTRLQTGLVKEVGRRTAKVYKVTQTIMTGVDILETKDWPGQYIPIVPVYGEEFSIEGKRYFRSLVNQAKDAQRQLNFWRSTATELASMAPRVPWIGRKGTFASDAENWATANTGNHAYLEFDEEMPQRQPLDSGVAAGSMQEALNASDDIKSITGLHDASLGARSNETSGKAILARQREGDTATFHFIDNLSRSIRHVGKILIDLIPHVYTEERIVRVLGEDGKESHEKINGETPDKDEDGNEMKDADGNVVMRIHDMAKGKYDIAVDTGPSFTTRREEAAAQMTELVRSYPDAAPYVADLMAQNFDWPGADELSRRFAKLNPAEQQGGIPPELQQQIQDGMKQIQSLTAENEKLKADTTVDQMQVQVDLAGLKVKEQELQVKLKELAVKEQEIAAQMQAPVHPFPLAG